MRRLKQRVKQQRTVKLDWSATEYKTFDLGSHRLPHPREGSELKKLRTRRRRESGRGHSKCCSFDDSMEACRGSSSV